MASSAGSTSGRGSSLGLSIRGAFATRGASSDADGSGAPSRRGRLAAFSLVVALLISALFASSAFASKDLISDFGTFSESGSFGGELNNPRDVAANETGVGPANAGDVYVADEANNRIERFDSAGNFISAWGKDTIAAALNERQRIVLDGVTDGTAGTYTLSFNGSTTAPISFETRGGNLQLEYLGPLPTIGSGNVHVSGEGTPGNPFIVTFQGALAGADQPTITADTSDLSGTVEISTIADGTSSVPEDTGTGFETCTVATVCQAGTASGENGALDHPQSVAVDQDTGNVYVSDRNNRRVDEYDGEGNFIRSFGFDVAESGPGDTGTGYEVCNEAEGDACKVGEGGAGVGQYGEGFAENGFGIAVSPADAGASTGSVYLADSGNRRVDTFDLDGTSPSSFGSSAQFGEEQPRSIAVDSRGIVYASDSNNNGDIQRYDSEDANGGGVGFLAPIVPPNDEQQEIAFTGFNTGDNYRLACPNGSPTEELTYVVGKGSGLEIIKNGLEAACGAGNFSFAGEPPNVAVTFEGALATSNQPQMSCTVLSGSGSCSVSTTGDGHPGPLLVGSASSATAGLAVNPAGTALYVLRDPSSGPTVVQQLGPTNAPGLTAPPNSTDDTHGTAAGLSAVQGFGLDSATGRLFVSATEDLDGFEGPLLAGHRVYVLADSSSLPNPTAGMEPIADVADRSATFEGTVDPTGGLVGCKFQYSTDEVNWTDAGFAEGTGNVVQGSTKVTNLETTSGHFAVGEKLSAASSFFSGTTIKAVGAETLTLSQPAAATHADLTLSASPEVPPDCASLGLTGGTQNVHQSVAGLAPNTHYFVRLQVTRPYFSSVTPVTSNVRNFTTASGPPAVFDATASAIDEHSVRVSAQIDPGHSPTTYVVQYGTTPALGSATAPVQIGAGSTPIEVSPVISGLSPATQYYFKVVATSLAGSAADDSLAIATYPSPPSFGSCPNDRFRTGPSAKLPDCRAYEQATPTDKFGADAFGSVSSVQASRAGDRITFYTLAGFPGNESLQENNIFTSHFVGGQWSTVGLNPPPSYGDRAVVRARTPDLRLSFIVNPMIGAGTSLMMRDDADGSYTVLIPPDEAVGFTPGGLVLGGAFDNDSKVVFRANGNVPVTSGPSPLSITRNVYLYDRETEELTLAGLLPDSACENPPCVPPTGSELPLAFESYAQDGRVVSPSGDVYFIDFASKQLYLRREAAGPAADTVPVSASERTDCADNDPCNGTPEPDPAGTFAPTFMGATPDGSQAFFKSRQKLTDDSSATAGAEDLYRFDADAPAGQRLTDLVPGAAAVGVLGYSDAGDHVYFAANADLDDIGQATSGDCAGKTGGFSGSCSIYLWQASGTGGCASAGGCVTFVARIDARGDGYAWAGNSQGNTAFQMKASRVSTDGRILVFRSVRQLTAYDNTPPDGACGREGKFSLPCPEFYRYDAESGQKKTSCLTCNPTGAPPTGGPDLKNPDMYHAPSSHAGYNPAVFLSRNLSPDGNRFFFQSAEKLVTADVNGEQVCPRGPDPETGAGAGGGPACTDVYEWEAAGTPGGSCTTNSTAYSPANGGCIYLLSTGTGAYPSYLADVSESGDTAFIFSRQQLVPIDEDTQEDIYAVKVDGGLAYQNAARPAACEGDACRGASSRPSDAPGAGSGVFEGPGNPKQGTNSTRCPKGKRTVHSKGRVRCVAKHKKHKHRGAHKRAANHNRRASR
jgi:hypothetical protein